MNKEDEEMDRICSFRNELVDLMCKYKSDSKLCFYTLMHTVITAFAGNKEGFLQLSSLIWDKSQAEQE